MDKYCRFLFATFIALAVFETTVDAQQYYGAYPGDVYATTYSTPQPVPPRSYVVTPMPEVCPIPYPVMTAPPCPVYPYPVVPFRENTITDHPTTRTLPPRMTVDPNNPPYDLNYLYYNHRDADGQVRVPQPARTNTEERSGGEANRQGEQSRQSEQSGQDEQSGQSGEGGENENQRSDSSFARSGATGATATAMPNMIGDSTSIPAKVLTYSFSTTEQVLIPNPNYVPWREELHTDVPLGTDTCPDLSGGQNVANGGLNVNDNLLLECQSNNGEVVIDDPVVPEKSICRDERHNEFIESYDVVEKNIAVPMPVTPTMYVTALNMSENFNAGVQDRFYVDLRYLGGGESYGVATDSGEAFTTRTDMSRMTIGIEKKIGDNHSVELRLPIVLVGLKSSQSIVGGGKAEHSSEFGNLSVVYKNVLKKTNEAVFSWGIGLNAPTAPDMKLHYQPIGGADPIRGTINNRKVSFIPYFGFQWNRDNRTFGHMVAQADVAVGKNRMDFTDRRYGETRYRTDIKEYSLLRFNVGTGRWVYENPIDASLFRLGLMAECHFTTNLDVIDPMVVPSRGASSDSFFSTTTGKRNWTSINVIFGIPIQTRRTTLTTFIGAPLTNTRYHEVEGGITADIRF